MNTATIQGFRKLATVMAQPERTRTAHEMALISHNLRKAGDIALEPSGQAWGWSELRKLWVAL